MEQKELYFPVNVIDRDDFITGFGAKEMAIAGIAFGVAVTAAISLYLSTGNMFMALFSGLVILIVTIVMIRRDKYDESLIDKFGYLILYYQSQKRYLYCYYNIYEGRYCSEKTEKEADEE